MVVPVIIGVVNVLPVPKLVPPIAAAYQLIVPVLAVACNFTEPALQRTPGVVLVIVGKLIITGVLTEVQPLAVASTNTFAEPPLAAMANVLAVPITCVPVLSAYQFNVAPADVAVNV